MNDPVQVAAGGFVLDSPRKVEPADLFIRNTYLVRVDIRRQRHAPIEAPDDEVNCPPAFRDGAFIAWSMPFYMPIDEVTVDDLLRGEAEVSGMIREMILSLAESTDERLRGEGKYLASGSFFFGTTAALTAAFNAYAADRVEDAPDPDM